MEASPSRRRDMHGMFGVEVDVTREDIATLDRGPHLRHAPPPPPNSVFPRCGGDWRGSQSHHVHGGKVACRDGGSWGPVMLCTPLAPPWLPGNGARPGENGSMWLARNLTVIRARTDGAGSEEARAMARWPGPPAWRILTGCGSKPPVGGIDPPTQNTPPAWRVQSANPIRAESRPFEFS
jgi:hypothetical protein